MSAQEKAAGVLDTPATAHINQTQFIVAPADDTSNDKRAATLKAKLAVAGFAVHGLDDGGFLVCRWNLSRHCQGMGELVAFARQTGVQ